VDCRVIAATNRELESEIRAGRFREDLLYRLNVVHLHSPPLRERLEDLPDLVDAFLREACQRNGKRPMQISSDALAVMSAYAYPGNVRELRNLVERFAILCEGPVISASEAAELMPQSRGIPSHTELLDQACPEHSRGARDRRSDVSRGVEAPKLPPPPAPSASSAAPSPGSAPPPARRGAVDRPFRDQVEDAEREIILSALAFTGDNVTEAAKLLDLERGHFYKKMKALGLRRGGGEKEG